MYVDVGFNNFVEAGKIITIGRPDSSPIRRMIQKAKDESRYVDMTQGKKTRSIIISSDNIGQILIGSTLVTTTIIGRLNKLKSAKIADSVVPVGIEIVGEGASE
jgi:regulator of extracellular matrix RemA (YlzA/DUF370 family)